MGQSRNRAESRARLRSRGRPFRFLMEAKVPDDPRTPARYRIGIIRTRLDRTPADSADGRRINRVENPRPVAEGDPRWDIVGGQRGRAEALNSRVKHRWANRRLNAVGVPRQTLPLLGIAVAISREATLAQSPPRQHAA